MKRFGVTLGILGAISAFMFGVAYGISQVPEPVVKTVIQEVPVEVIQEVEVVKEVEVIREVVVEVPVVSPNGQPDMAYFPSYSAAKEWLAQDKTDEIPFNGWRFDCNNYAQTLMENAIRDGWYISTDARCTSTGCHMYCTTIINGYLFEIEPQTDMISRWLTLK